MAVVARARPHDPVRDQRPLGPARGRLQQRPRAAPGLERVAAQRLRARARTPAIRSARTGSRSPPRRSRGSRSGRPSSARSSRSAILTALTALGGAARARHRRGGRWRRCWSPCATWPPPTTPRAPSRRPPRRCSSSPSRSPCRRRPPTARRGGGPAAGARRRCSSLAGRDPLLLQLRRARLADRDRRPLGADLPRGAARAARRGAAARGCGGRATLAWVGRSSALAVAAARLRRPVRLRRRLRQGRRAATPTGRSRRSRRSASGRRPTTASTPPAARRCRARGAIAILALIAGLAWWLRRARARGAVALAACTLSTCSRSRSAATTRGPRR